MTLRSLSAREEVGFILVGGEKMPEILSTQGEVLNKFRPLRIGYLDRQSQWLDFVELVRRPVESWAEITDDAILKLYKETEGNPFFTKSVCGEMVSEMLRQRDAFVTEVEMTRAIEAAAEGAGANQFQHFWDDGVVATTSERTSQERASRRRVLVALGETIRSGVARTSQNISSKASRFGLAEMEVDRLLSTFERRKVLVREGDEYRCKVGLFERWLVDEGVSELALSLVEEEGLRAELVAEEQERVKSQEIKMLVDAWGSYRGTAITDVSVTSWLEQFKSVHERRIIYRLLEGIRFYSGDVVREKLRVCHGFVVRELAARGVVRRAGPRKGTDNVLISYYGGEGKRGPSYAKLYADENGIYHERITRPEGLRRQIETLDDVEGVVFVDDFIGTGRTASGCLTETLPPISDLLIDRDIDVFLVAISGFAAAGEKVGRKMSKGGHRVKVSIADPLDAADQCFSETSTIFPDSAMRAEARAIVHTYGATLSKSNPLGVGNCQALVVFDMTCPNNSLPILWASGPDKAWRPLFPKP